MKEIRTVVIVGAGTMGHALAQVFAQGGHDVWLQDIREKALPASISMIASNLATQVELGMLEKDQPASILKRIRTTTNLAEACNNADLVIEAVIEDAKVKKELFASLDKLCPPHAILASNTSYLDIFKFVETGRPDKVLIAHWFAPPHIVPLVELVPGPETSAETVETLKALLLKLGKKPMVLAKFLPGFIANRLQAALRKEVFFLLDNGYATAEQIDDAIKSSFGLRIPILGVRKRMDYGGLDLSQKLMSNSSYDPAKQEHSPTIDKLVAEGRLGIKSGRGFYDYGGRSPEELMRERDIKLLKLREFLKEIGEMT